nr:transposase, MuDR, MULE transposase domain protein [Tanacetum cinerariifolium]
MANEGTVTHIETDDKGRFKMCFMAFGFAIRSFLTHMRPLLITDGAHLKGTYKGTNLVLVGMDGNNQFVPIATGVSQGETEESWTWFLLKFKECIGEVPNLAIITNRHLTIILACNTIFPNAFHGYCCRHLMMNCKMKNDKLQAIYWKTCKAYTTEEFQRRVYDLRGLRPKAYKKLEEAGFETWSREMCPADRYNYLTSNSAESINNLTRHVRKASITQLMEWYKALLQKWYCARRNKYKDYDANTLSDWVTHKVIDRMQKSAHWKVLGIEYGRLYKVDDRRRVHQLDLTFRTCTCRKWQLLALYSTYQDLVYPIEEPSSWVRPDGLQVVKPPNMNFRTSGIPKNTDRIKSQGKEPIHVRCSRCGVHGHNRTTCHEPIANYQAMDATQPRLKRSRETRQESNIHVDLGGHSQEYEATYNNNYVWSQEYEAAYTNNYVMSQEYETTYTNNYVRSQEYETAYTNNYVRSQEYEATYTNNYVRSQEYEVAFNNMNGGSQGYEAAYTNFNSMFEQANINFGGQSKHPLPTTPFTFSQFNLGQSSQQTYSTWDSSSWDPVNLADPWMNLYCDNEQCFKKRL